MTVNSQRAKIFTTYTKVVTLMIHENNLENIEENSKIYFIGIDGISMSGLAEIALHLGFQVSGSDPRTSNQTRRLEAKGVKVNKTQIASNITEFQPDLVVYSSAIPDTNEELALARANGITSVIRAKFLGWLTRKFSNVINVAGTHGKSTTTGLLALIFMESGMKPTTHLGSEFEYFNDMSINLGEDDLMLNEADEYTESFLNFYSTSSAILNIDADHLDFYGSLDKIIESFVKFANNLEDDGHLIIPHDDDNITEFLDMYKQTRASNGKDIHKIITFGAYNPDANTNPDYAYANIEYSADGAHFDLYKNDEFYADFVLGVPGEHNISNAVVALILAELHGTSLEGAKTALRKFKGVSGRFDYFGTFKGAEVVADYAHHPTEIAATLEAAENVHHNKIWPIVQVLNYSRARDYYDDYLDLLADYPFVIYYKIYSSREFDDYGQSAEKFAADFNSKYNEAVASNTVEDLIDVLALKVEEGDLILFLGPEDLRQAAVDFCRSEHGVYYKDQK